LSSTDSTWYSDGSGLAKDILAHRGGTVFCKITSLSNGMSNLGLVGNAFIYSNPGLTHNNFELYLDTGTLLIGDSFFGANISISATRSS
jgi:hypothetical protein